jgi:hypothetical protein
MAKQEPAQGASGSTLSAPGVDLIGCLPVCEQARVCQTWPVRGYLGSDHAGHELRTRLIEWLVGAGHEPKIFLSTPFSAAPRHTPGGSPKSPTTRRPANSRPSRPSRVTI